MTMVRSGIGYDIHRLVPDRRLVLGGVAIDHPTGLAGHSDGDVLAHAIMDALLGATALGDLGTQIAPHLAGMRDRLSGALGIERAAVSVKATTNDALGIVGAGEAIATLATVIVEKSEP
jgi:2C-methyl-D-erythritol 2,4-cyclodiphosphate synthase